MNFIPVVGGATPAVALQLRGSEPVFEAHADFALFNALQNFLHLAVGSAPNLRTAPGSVIAYTHATCR